MRFLVTRIRFFIAHIAVSLILTGFIAYLVYGIWYSKNMAILLGVSLIVILLSIVSIVIWPLLTALVVKSDKKEQRRDHIILWSIQTIFTLFTLYFLFISRVVWSPYTVDLFEIVRQKDIVYSEDIALAPQYKVGIFQPFKWLGAAFSDDEELGKIQHNEDLDGISIARRVDALVPIAEKHELMQKYAQPLDALLEFNAQEEVAHIREQYPQATQWLAIKGFVRDGVVLTDQNFSFFEIVLLQPWEDAFLDDDSD